MGAHLGWCGFIIPQRVLLDYAKTCLTEIAEVAMGLAVEGLGGPRPRTCVCLTGWVREGLYMSSVGRGRQDARH